MTKKLISILISLSVAAASFTALAYDPEKGAPQFMADHADEFETSQEVEEKRNELIIELVGSYGYTDEEALEVLEVFKKSIDEKSGKKPEDGTDSDKNDSEDKNKPQDIVISDEIAAKKTVLEQLEIIRGEDCDYNAAVRRDTFAGYTADMINYGGDYSAEEGYFKFNDVTEENEKYHAIANLINKGAIVGVGEGLYKPEDSITVNQACAVIVRVTGYDVYKMPDDENDIFYWNKARDMGLLDGIKVSNTETLIGENAVKMLYNLMFADVVSVKFDGRNADYTNEEVFMNKYMNMDYADGVVTANSKTSLNSESGAVGESRLMVENETYHFEKIGELDSYLGKNVRVFYTDDDSGKAKAITERSNYNKYFTVNAKDIEKFDVTDARLEYYKPDSDKLFKEDIPLNAKIIFNGVAVDYEYNRKQMMQPMIGEITVIDNDRDSKADVVLVTSYVYYLAETVNKDMPKLYDNFSIQPEIDLDKNSIEVYKDGEATTVSAIGKEALVMVKPSRVTFDQNTNYMYADLENSTSITLEIVSNSATGDVSSVNKNDNTIKIGGKQYDISKWVEKSYDITGNEKFKMPANGYNVRAVTDKYDNVVYFVINSRGGLKYGFVVRLFENDETGEEMIKIFSQDNEMVKVPLAKKIKVHNRWDQNAELTTTSYYSKRVDKSVLHDINGEGITRKMVKYMLNSSGELSEIYVPDFSKGINEENFSRSFDYYVGDDVFMRGFHTGETTSLTGESEKNMFGIEAFQAPSGVTSYYFIIPPEDSADEEYLMGYDLFSGKANMEYYDVTEAGMPQCCVQYGKASTAKTGEKKGNETIMIVTDEPSQKWNEETEQIEYTLSAYAYGAASVSMFSGIYRTYTFADNEMVSFNAKGETAEKKARHNNIPIAELQKGDVLTAYISNGVINGYGVQAHKVGEKLSDGELDYGLYDTDNNVLWPNGYHWLQYGYTVKGKIIRAIDNTYFYVDTKNPEGIFRRVILNYTPNNRDMVMIYDAKKNTITEATSSDIRVGDYMVSFRNRLAVVVRNYE